MNLLLVAGLFLQGEAGGAPSDTSQAYSFPERKASTHVEKLIESVLPKLVKVHGASGLQGIPGYATGCLVSPRGHVLTIDHVMLQPEQVKVVLADGSVHEAKILRRDDALGVAMLKIEQPVVAGKPVELDYLKVPGDVELWPGRVLVSLGNAFRLAEFSEKMSATLGVMVARSQMNLRFKTQKFTYSGEVIITDAPNNPGAYGGGLFTLTGEWVGLNGPIVETPETNTQLSLAFPTSDLRAFILRATGDTVAAAEIEAEANRKKAERKPVFHGIRLFESGRLRSPPAYVERVLAGSPGAAAGLRPDDLIVRLDDFPIRTCEEFQRVMKTFEPGKKVDVTIKRRDQVMKIEMTLTEAKEKDKS